MATGINITITNAFGVERVLTLPGKYEVCDRCRGKGTHVNPSIDEHGITQEEFDQDPGFQEDYMSGVYDVQCYECKGERVVMVIDRELMVDHPRVRLGRWRGGSRTRARILARIDDAAQADWEYEQMCRMERESGA